MQDADQTQRIDRTEPLICVMIDWRVCVCFCGAPSKQGGRGQRKNALAQWTRVEWQGRSLMSLPWARDYILERLGPSQRKAGRLWLGIHTLWLNPALVIWHAYFNLLECYNNKRWHKEDFRARNETGRMSRQSQRQGESSEHWADITNINQTRHSPKLPAGKRPNRMLETKLPEIKRAGGGPLVKFLSHYSVINQSYGSHWLAVLWSRLPGLAMQNFPKHIRLFLPVKLSRQHQLSFFVSW